MPERTVSMPKLTIIVKLTGQLLIKGKKMLKARVICSHLPDRPGAGRRRKAVAENGKRGRRERPSGEGK
jgi:hypothetical protein